MIEATAEGLSDYERAIIPMRGDGRFRSDEDMLACCALGLAEEISEVISVPDGDESQAVSELGDVLWYATTAAHRLGFTLGQIRARETNTGLTAHNNVDRDHAREMALYAGLFAGLIKKHLFHEKPLNRSLAGDYLAEILDCAELFAESIDRTLDDAFDANVAKIRRRFPSGGFTAAEANARADESR